jgi:hypothetical protein
MSLPMNIHWLKRNLRYLLPVASVLLAVIVALSWHHLHPQTLTAAQTLKKQASFPVYYPTSNQQDVSVDDATAKIAMMGGDKVLNFIVSIGQKKVTISEQSYPDALIYDKLTSTFANQSEINTSFGKVTVGRPKDAPESQAAVVKTGDTLIFAKPDQDLSNQEWQLVFNALDKV